MPYLLITILLLLSLAAVAEPTPPVYKNANALLMLGQDGQVYLAGGAMILHCDRDGGNPVLGAGGHALLNVTANPQGIIAAAHAHFAKDVTLLDQEFHTLHRYTRIGNYNFTVPAEVTAGQSGDFYVLDQGRDQIVRFHPDGIRCAIYCIPHEDYPDKRFGYLTHFRVCEATKTLYALNWQNLRCFDISSTEFSFTPKLKWELKNPNLCLNLSYGYGGFDVDENGVLYTIMPLKEEFLTAYGADGKLLKKIPLKVGDRKFVDPTRVLGLGVSKGEAFIKRKHDSEMFLRFSLESGELLTAATLPADLAAILRAPTAGGGKPIVPVKSTLGIPADRKKVLRVLFVGNSQVNCVRDIPEMVEEISRSAADKSTPLILTDEVVVGGTGLEGYWKNGLAQQRIAAGGWDYVVINEIVYSFGLTNTAKFNEYAGKFDEIIRKAGAKTLIFSTADVDKRREQHPKMYADAAAVAKARGCRVAGAGMAWLKAWEQDPALDFHYTDRAHPNDLGYYLNALVIFAALTDTNPTEQAVSTCDAATPEQAALLQKVAWEQYQTDRKNEK